MTFDVFFSICQTPVDGYMPSEKVMLQNFFDQIRLADQLGYGCAWIAETHLSCQVQKRNPGAVIPHFQGEIGLNTDVLQVAHKVFGQTKKIHIGSAIRNILCNGGPMAHAESVRMFLSLHGLQEGETRLLELGFASGRFPFSNSPYGIKPRNELEVLAWPVLRGLVFLEAVEIFLRFLRGEVFSSTEVTAKILRPELFRTESEWLAVAKLCGKTSAKTSAKLSETQQIDARTGSPTQIAKDAIEIAPFWTFDQVGVIPAEAPLDLLRLTIGAHDAVSQNFANRFLPVGVFNLSITPGPTIEETHQRMTKVFNSAGGAWSRSRMPRTVLVFIDESEKKAKERAASALENYWRAVEGTLDPKKIEQATENALIGTPEQIKEQMRERFHPDDRLMLWFDFNNHDNAAVQKSMRHFIEKVAIDFQGPALQSKSQTASVNGPSAQK
jgi:alkanesulfonate monooxygenase SsuD/methylene tetrahydromethanopterin reductase-like flavin-dependent oxidoreductase (luciferase family)